jgi:RNA-directed DNA polymerase
VFDFLGFRIQWKRKRGTNKWYVYTLHRLPAYPVAKGKDPCPYDRRSHRDLRYVLIRLNQIMRGWASYYKYAARKHTLSSLAKFAW